MASTVVEEDITLYPDFEISIDFRWTESHELDSEWMELIWFRQPDLGWGWDNGARIPNSKYELCTVKIYYDENKKRKLNKKNDLIRFFFQ